NPGYQKIALPQQFWPLLDTFKSPTVDLNGCLRKGGIPEAELDPMPILPLIASPVASLTIIAEKVQFGLSNARTRCVQLNEGDASQGSILRALGRQQPGFRFMLGITSLAAARFAELNTAALQSTATDANNRTFVAPDDGSVRTAMQLAQPDTAAGMWR